METKGLTIDQMYDLLTAENKEIVNRQIALLIAAQSDCQ